MDVAIAPPYTALAAAVNAAANSAIAVGAQNMHWEREGAFTGEVSAAMIRETGARYVIVGHSERRTLFGDTNETVNKRIHAALPAGLVPIVCIGETLAERDRNETMEVLDGRSRKASIGDTGEQLSEWCSPMSRSGRSAPAATPRRRRPAKRTFNPPAAQAVFGLDAAERCRLLYGGSVKPDNIAN